MSHADFLDLNMETLAPNKSELYLYTKENV